MTTSGGPDDQRRGWAVSGGANLRRCPALDGLDSIAWLAVPPPAVRLAPGTRIVLTTPPGTDLPAAETLLNIRLSLWDMGDQRERRAASRELWFLTGCDSRHEGSY